MGVSFDGWLENELSRDFEQAAGRKSAPPRYTSLPPLKGRPTAHTAAALAKSKAAIAAATLTLTLGAGVGAKAAVTGNANPFDWGHKVEKHVVACKQHPSPDHTIGHCVSDFAKQHGVQIRQAHATASPHATGRSSHPTKRGASHPTGPPNAMP